MEILEKNAIWTSSDDAPLLRCRAARVLVFFALNMAGGFSPAFSAGSAQTDHKMYAVLLFTACSPRRVFHRRPRRPDPRHSIVPSSSIDRKTASSSLPLRHRAVRRNFAKVPESTCG